MTISMQTIFIFPSISLKWILKVELLYGIKTI